MLFCSRLRTHSAFTLTELIVVITVLAILGTIGFISLQNSASKSRDSNRVATVRTAVTGLTTKVIESGLYPIPDGQVSTGSINGVEVAYKGEFGERVGRAIHYSFPLPKDPLTGTPLPYGISFNKQYFQLAVTLENITSTYQTPNILIQDVYAATPMSAKVDGNYQGFMKFSSGSSLYIANLPGLIWFGSGTLDFTPPALSARFVRDGGTNVAYVFDGNITSITETPTQTLQAMTQSGTTTFTGANITGLNDASSLSSVLSGSTLAQFGISPQTMESIVLGKSSDGVGGGGLLSDCSPPWGGTTTHGTSVTAYQSPTISYPGTCISQSRTCTNGSLSGTYMNQSCSITYTYSWSSSAWGSCSVSCGGGMQSRSVICQRNDGTTVDDSFCSGAKPTTSQSCNNDACIPTCGLNQVYFNGSCVLQYCGTWAPGFGEYNIPSGDPPVYTQNYPTSTNGGWVVSTGFSGYGGISNYLNNVPLTTCFYLGQDLGSGNQPSGWYIYTVYSVTETMVKAASVGGSSPYHDAVWFKQ